MAGLSKTELLTMEYFYDGEPLVYVANSTLTPDDLESEYIGEPFVGEASGAAAPVTKMTVVIIT